MLEVSRQPTTYQPPDTASIFLHNIQKQLLESNILVVLTYLSPSSHVLHIKKQN